MAYQPHAKCILQGVLGGSALTGTEIWSTGFALNVNGVDTVPTQSQADTVASYLSGVFTNSDMNLCSNAYLTSVFFVGIEADGKWTRDPSTGGYIKRIGHFGGPVAGYASSNREFPTSVVTSLMTPRAGAHGRGRMYWPLPAEPPQSNGYYSDAAAGNRASTLATAFHNINTTLASGSFTGDVVVASKAGYLSSVTGVRVGNVHDVQRRRRDALRETYQVALVP